MLSVIGIISSFVSSLSAKFRTTEMVGKVGTYCAAHSGPRAALYKLYVSLELNDKSIEMAETVTKIGNKCDIV